MTDIEETAKVPVDLLKHIAWILRGVGYSGTEAEVESYIPKPPRVLEVTKESLAEAIHGLVYSWRSCAHQNDNQSHKVLSIALFNRLEELNDESE